MEEKDIEKVNKTVKKEKKVNKEIEKLKDENKALNDKVLRLTAEIQNISRRNDEEKSKLFKYDGETIIKKILPFVDDLERAIKMDDDNLDDEVSKFLSGIKITYSNLISVLNKEEIREMNCVGETFDPNLMEAVLRDNNEKYGSNIVTEVLQKGYIYKDKVLRHAMVKVNE